MHTAYFGSHDNAVLSSMQCCVLQLIRGAYSTPYFSPAGHATAVLGVETCHPFTSTHVALPLAAYPVAHHMFWFNGCDMLSSQQHALLTRKPCTLSTPSLPAMSHRALAEYSSQHAVNQSAGQVSGLMSLGATSRFIPEVWMRSTLATRCLQAVARIAVASVGPRLPDDCVADASAMCAGDVLRCNQP